MRLAFFSPMPPAKSGIADYSAALLEPLRSLVEVEVFEKTPAEFDPRRFDVCLYQIGNNPWHVDAYETALRAPGVVVMHEGNLHHLIADLTIRRNNWDAYLKECEYNGGAAALEYARRVRALEAGPDYEGLPMLRRLLERSRAAIVHSRAVECQLRTAGFAGPIARIPHGAWVERTPDRNGYRHRLGIDESTPLIGIFGFIKPYKRIAESLRAFRRLARLEPRVKLILGGEAHPDFPIDSMIETLGLQASVRVLGFLPIEHFEGYLSACDVVLNLRYPTVGETSGSLLRALGLGRAVIVSDVGSFSELPSEICLKAPVGPGEEDVIFEYLNLLVSRPDLARGMGDKARQWVERECRWEHVARRYVEFCEAVAQGREWVEIEPTPAEAQATEPPPEREREPEKTIKAEDVLSWAATPEARGYVETHLSRLERTLTLTPKGGPDRRILEMGAYFQITPALRSHLGYGEVRGCYYGQAGEIVHREVTSETGEKFRLSVELFDAEKDIYPYPNEYFDTVLCCELIEHLFADPMFLMHEVNRILKPGGALVLTTPNIASLRAIAAILQGYHPGFFPAYIRPSDSGEVEARHNREYAPKEIAMLFADAGFEVTHLETGPFRDEPQPDRCWVEHLLDRYLLPKDLRGDGIYAVGRKAGKPRERYPEWLYSGGA